MARKPRLRKRILKVLLKPKLVIPPKLLAGFTRQMATMLEAGMPLTQALRTLVEQCEGVFSLRGPRQVLSQIVSDVEAGTKLSEAVAEHPKSFSRFYVNMLQSAEASGKMVEILRELAAHMERLLEFRKKIISSLVYPAVVLTVAVGVSAVLLIFVVPRFVDIFNDLLGAEQELPALTQFVMGFSYGLKNHFLKIVAAAGAVIFFIAIIRKTRRGKFVLDFLAIKVPPFKSFVLRSAVSRFSSTLSTLLGAGVPVLTSVEILYATTSNEVVRRSVKHIYDSINEGRGIAPALEADRLFPVMVVRLVEVGEKTGALPDMLARISSKYEEEVDNALETLISLIEPVMIVFMAVFVGTIVIALFMPLVSIMEGLAT